MNLRAFIPRLQNVFIVNAQSISSENMEFMKSLLYKVARFVPIRWLPLEMKLRMLVRSRVLDAEWHRKATQQSPLSELELARQVWDDDRERVANPFFSADFYRHHYGFSGSPGEALLHYVLVGERKGRKPTEWFEPNFFRQQHPEAPAGLSAIGLYGRHWTQYPRAHPYFDSYWYIQANPDVAQTGRSPLDHFVNDGLQEGREPNEFFDSGWYLAQNPDVVATGMSAATHFCVYGARELRNPSPLFDVRRYIAKHPDCEQSGLDPLAHFLVQGRPSGFDISRLVTQPQDLIPTSFTDKWLERGRTMRVDVIIPVYKDLAETRDCIESVLASELGPNVRLVVRNDASPEPEVTAWLRERAATGAFILQENDVNLGFVGTVNVSMRESIESGAEAVLLLNSDTEVAGDWVTRMAAHAAARSEVSSVTALSNNATICSWPKLGSNPMPPGASVSELDAAARAANAGTSVEIPTGVGFCMLITAASLRDVGLFDEKAFGKGYGEENDFCMRASEEGYVHLLAQDVFVHHQGEVSFASDSGPGKQRAEKIILTRYPNYNRLVSNHVGQDPGQVGRIRMLAGTWRAGAKPITAYISHHLGGGTDRQVMALAQAASEDGHAIVIKPVAGFSNRVHIENPFKQDGFELVLAIDSGEDLSQVLQLFGVQKVEIHHVLGHGAIIREALAISGIPFEFHVHDYYTICPQVTLTDKEFDYCGEPDAHGCNACIAGRPSHGATDIVNWRSRHAWLGLRADRVVAPSTDAATRVSRYIGRDVEARPHEAPVQQATAGNDRYRRRTYTHDAPLRLVLLGALAPHKGKFKVLELLEAISARDLPAHVHLIGYLGVTEGEMRPEMAKHFSSSGWYRDHELDGLIQAAKPDAFLFASTAPETYSFTLTAALKTGLPILATRLGAFIERLEGYPGATLYPPLANGNQICDVLAETYLDRIGNTNAA